MKEYSHTDGGVELASGRVRISFRKAQSLLPVECWHQDEVPLTTCSTTGCPRIPGCSLIFQFNFLCENNKLDKMWSLHIRFNDQVRYVKNDEINVSTYYNTLSDLLLGMSDFLGTSPPPRPPPVAVLYLKCFVTNLRIRTSGA